MAKRVTYDYIRNIDPAEVSKMSKREVVSLLKQVRGKYETRAKVLDKYGDKVYSPAKEKMDAYYETSGKIAPSKISRNRAYNEIFQIQQFFKAKTSDVKGAREVMRDQDIRIFGSTKTGRPKKRMTTAQRTRFWSLYEDFISTNKTAEYVFGYSNIWQELGNIVIEDSSGNKLELFDTLEERLLKNQETGTGFGTGTVFSGEWDSF